VLYRAFGRKAKKEKRIPGKRDSDLKNVWESCAEKLQRCPSGAFIRSVGRELHALVTGEGASLKRLKPYCSQRYFGKKNTGNIVL